MHKAALFLSLAFIATAPEALADPPPAPDSMRWAPIPELSDEFDGTTLDATKWRNGHPHWKGRIPSVFVPQNVSLMDGALTLRTTSRIRRPREVREMTKDIWIDTACVSSLEPIALYGYYEARMKASDLPTSSSFWLQGRWSEIDIDEAIGDSITVPDSVHKMWSSTRYFPNGFARHVDTTTQEIPVPSPDTDWHVYGVWWKDPRTVWFYLDGVKVSEQRTAADFTEPLYLFFDSEAFLWEGLPSIALLSDPSRNTTSVDWVRSWRLVPAAPSRP